jgi:hypothetical protein
MGAGAGFESLGECRESRGSWEFIHPKLGRAGAFNG